MTQQLLFQRDLLIDAPLTHVWQLVATEDGLRQWWGNTIYLEAKEGGRCEEWRPGRHQQPSHWQGVVTLYAPPHQLMLTLRAQDQSQGQRDGEPDFTTIAIALAVEGDKTRVQVTQRGFGPTRAVATPDRQQEQPEWRQGVPLAQLTQPAPGTLPMTNKSPAPASGRIDPSHLAVTRPQLDALTRSWQMRLTALTTAAAEVEQP